MIRSTGSQPFGWSKIILGKLAREDGAPGRMPLGMPAMKVEDQAVLKAYFDLLKSTATK